MDPCRQDKNNAEGAGPANQNAGPDDAIIVGPQELIRMPRRDAAGRREPIRRATLARNARRRWST